jgi:hypothetical protein
VLIANGNDTEWVLSPARRPDHFAPDLLVAASLIVAGSVSDLAARRGAAPPVTPAGGVRQAEVTLAGRGPRGQGEDGR